MIDQLMQQPAQPRSEAPETGSARPRGSFWSRHSTLINFWLDALLLILFMVQAWIIAVLYAVFPRGAGKEWTIWGANAADWFDALFVTFCVFSAAIVVHVMFHWGWVCGVVSTRILRRKAGKDDGSQTLIGVGLIVVLIHVLMAGILAARVGLTSTT